MNFIIDTLLNGSVEEAALSAVQLHESPWATVFFIVLWGVLQPCPLASNILCNVIAVIVFISIAGDIIDV